MLARAKTDAFKCVSFACHEIRCFDVRLCIAACVKLFEQNRVPIFAASTYFRKNVFVFSGVGPIP